jgi:hypothetical protein
MRSQPSAGRRISHTYRVIYTQLRARLLLRTLPAAPPGHTSSVALHTVVGTKTGLHHHVEPVCWLSLPSSCLLLLPNRLRAFRNTLPVYLAAFARGRCKQRSTHRQCYGRLGSNHRTDQGGGGGVLPRTRGGGGGTEHAYLGNSGRPASSPCSSCSGSAVGHAHARTTQPMNAQMGRSLPQPVRLSRHGLRPTVVLASSWLGSSRAWQLCSYACMHLALQLSSSSVRSASKRSSSIRTNTTRL